MLCQICNKRSATLHMTRIINGEKTEMHICNECAKEVEGLNFNIEIPNSDMPFSFSNILSGLMDFAAGNSIAYQGQRTIKCTGCGLDYEEFKKVGRFGCSNCYSSFNEKLDPIIKRIHGNTQHTGKIPKRSGEQIKIKRDIEKLKYELKKSIENEEYEKAAELRDKIKNMENSSES